MRIEILPQEKEIECRRSYCDGCESYGSCYSSIEVINLTPHEVKVYNKEGKKVIFSFPPEGIPPRVKENTVPDISIGEIKVVRKSFQSPEGLPEGKPYTYYIVPSLVAQSVPQRRDLLVPDTGPESVIRDEKGKILGVRRFYRIS